MNKSEMMDMVLEQLSGDMDDLEGTASMSHSLENCPDPIGCSMHDDEHGDNLSPAAAGKDGGGVEIEIKNIGDGMPSMDGAKEEAAENGLTEEETEALRKLLK